MQTQSIPILIFAQSGRFLAQSAIQAGYSVWVADCYGDVDLLAVADRWRALPSFTKLTHDIISTALSELTRGEQCMLVCGSGIELCHHLLLPLPANIQLVGNIPDIIQVIKNPILFSNLLSQHAFNYPDTQFEAPSDDLIWLKKQATGTGGSHIEYATSNAKQIDDGFYYQRFISGNCGSCLFLADGHDAHLVSINQQHLAPTQQSPFRLGRIESAWQLSHYHCVYLRKVVNQLSAATNLVGLNSLDFVISDKNELFILEINPRVSASAELIRNQAALFQQHLDACLGQLQSLPSLNSACRSLFYHYAATNLVVPDNMRWPTECHDLPIAGSIIKQGEPICTSQVEPDENNLATQLHFVVEQIILKQLMPYQNISTP